MPNRGFNTNRCHGISEIDNLVYKLYNLTDEEINIIKNSITIGVLFIVSLKIRSDEALTEITEFFNED